VDAMEFLHQLLSIPKVFRWLRTLKDISESGPSNDIMKLPITLGGLENAINFPLFRVVQDHCVMFDRWLACDSGCILIQL
jgi:hypothetical protein